MEQIYYNLLPLNVEGTTLIPLSQGYWALVDTEIALIAPKFWLNKNKKKSVIYAKRDFTVDKKVITQYLHRFVLEYYEIDAPNDIDHINRNGLDNRLCNLRAATQSQNEANTGLQKNNKSGARGVCWNKNAKKWIVQLTVDGNNTYLGLFNDLSIAIRTYDLASIAYWGIERAYTNFPKSDYLTDKNGKWYYL